MNPLFLASKMCTPDKVELQRAAKQGQSSKGSESNVLNDRDITLIFTVAFAIEKV